MKACDLAKGTVVELNGDPHIVEQLRTQTPSARGAATLYKVRFRNLRTRAKLDQTYKGDDALKECDFDTRKVEFSYSEGDRFTFMDQEDYSQYELMRDELGDATDYLIDGTEGIKALFKDGKLLGIQMPDSVDLEITECAPSMRGASVTARTKAATLETGILIVSPGAMSTPGASAEKSVAPTLRIRSRAGLMCPKSAGTARDREGEVMAMWRFLVLVWF